MMDSQRAGRLLLFVRSLPGRIHTWSTYFAAALTLVSLVACAPEVVRQNESGNEHFENQEYDQAIEDYKLAQVADPDRSEPYYNAANGYNRTGDVDTTLAQTRQALKSADPALASKAWYNLGNAYFDAEQWAPAIEAYKEGLRLAPDDMDAKHNLELALQNLKEQQQQQQQDQQSQQESSSQSEEEESSDNSEDQGQETTPTPEGQGAQNEPDEAAATPQPSGEAQESQELSPDQAMQLLNALLGSQDTLQERLQQLTPIAGPTPAQDW